MLLVSRIFFPTVARGEGGGGAVFSGADESRKCFLLFLVWLVGRGFGSLFLFSKPPPPPGRSLAWAKKPKTGQSHVLRAERGGLGFLA